METLPPFFEKSITRLLLRRPGSSDRQDRRRGRRLAAGDEKTWVQTGGPTWWNYIKTGLWGGKYDVAVTSEFPWLSWKHVPSNAPFSNYVTGFIEQSRLMWPKSWEFFKGLLGQRVIR
jgi:hypothetical protein